MAFAKVSSDALPALTGRRCVGTVQSGRILSGKQGGTAELVFLSLFPYGGARTFLFVKEIYYDEEITRQTMVKPDQLFSHAGQGLASEGDAGTFSIQKMLTTPRPGGGEPLSCKTDRFP